MGQVAVAVKLTIKEGQRDAMTAAVMPGLETAKTEGGTITYIFHHDVADANLVWFYELYADNAAFDAHMKTEAFKTFSASLAPFIAGAPEFHILNPIGGKGL